MFPLFLLKPGGMALRFRACGICIQPPPSLIKILITDAAYLVAGGKNLASLNCVCFWCDRCNHDEIILVCFLSPEEFFFFFLRGRSAVLKMQFHELIIVQ